MTQKPEIYLPEAIHTPAFRGNSMANPQFAEADQIDQLSQTSLQEFHRKFYQPSRMIIAGAGLKHEELLELSKKCTLSPFFFFDSSPLIPTPWISDFGDMKDTEPLTKATPAQYAGGDLILPNESTPYAHMMVTFHGIPYSDSDLYAIATLQLIMGGGGSFSAGGPGKGMYSRLCTDVLYRFLWLHTATTYNNCYSDTGLFGFHFGAEPKHAKEMFDAMAQECVKMALYVSEVELARARNQLKSSLLMNLESRIIQLEDIAKQVQILGKRLSAEELCSHIDKVTVQDVVRVARRIVFSKPPAVVLYGKIGNMPKNPSKTFWDLLVSKVNSIK